MNGSRTGNSEFRGTSHLPHPFAKKRHWPRARGAKPRLAGRVSPFTLRGEWGGGNAHARTLRETAGVLCPDLPLDLPPVIKLGKMLWR